MELDIPSIANQGFDRSIYQRLTKIVITPDSSISHLQDALQPSKVTVLAVQLSQHALMEFEFPHTEPTAFHPEIKLNLRSKMLMLSQFGDACGALTGTGDWYVFKRKNGGLCFAHQGTKIEGGTLAYTQLYYTTSEEDANNWINSHPEQCL